MSAPTKLADMNDLFMAIYERLSVAVIGATFSLQVDSDTGSISVIMPNSSVKRTIWFYYPSSTLFADPSDDAGRVKRNGDIGPEFTLMFEYILAGALFTGGRYSAFDSRLLWLDSEAVIEGQFDLPHVCGIPGIDGYSAQIRQAPYHWPVEKTMNVGYNGEHGLGKWLAKLGLTYTTPKGYDVDNAEYFDMVKKVCASLMAFIIPVDSYLNNYGSSNYLPAHGMCSYRTASGEGSSFAEAIANAEANLLEAAWQSEQYLSYCPGAASALERSVSSGAATESYSVSISEIKESGVALWNTTEYALDIDLYIKSASQYYDYQNIPDDNTQPDALKRYKWQSNSPFAVTPDGNWHKIAGCSATVQPGEVFFRTLPGSVMLPDAPSLPPAPAEEPYSISGSLTQGLILDLRSREVFVAKAHFQHPKTN